MSQVVVVKRAGGSVTLAQHWGERVAEARAASGQSQASLAARCGVTQQTISRIETGAAIPHDHLKVVVARAVGRRPDHVFSWPLDSALAVPALAS